MFSRNFYELITVCFICYTFAFTRHGIVDEFERGIRTVEEFQLEDLIDYLDMNDENICELVGSSNAD